MKGSVKILLLLALPVLLPVPQCVASASSEQKIPTLFADQPQFDRYAACLAATEGLRRLRDQQISQDRRHKRKFEKEYQQRAKQILSGLDMQESEFNKIGRKVARNDNLKRQVIEQAYLYRIAASVNMDKVPINYEAPADLSDDRLLNFCSSLTEMERYRMTQLERLKTNLNLDQLPVLSDPSLVPMLRDDIRTIVEGFPIAAEEIAAKYGFDSNEYDSLLNSLKTNIGFRKQVQQTLRNM